MYRLVEVISDVGMVWDDLAVVLESEVKPPEEIKIPTSPSFCKMPISCLISGAVAGWSLCFIWTLILGETVPNGSR